MAATEGNDKVVATAFGAGTTLNLINYAELRNTDNCVEVNSDEDSVDYAAFAGGAGAAPQFIAAITAFSAF